MTTTAIRERLHHFIDTIEDKKATAIYTLLEDSMAEGKDEYSSEFKAELDRRYAQYKKDGEVITREEMDKRIKIVTGKNQ